jgi:hypothetical protein
MGGIKDEFIVFLRRPLRFGLKKLENRALFGLVK